MRNLKSLLLVAVASTSLMACSSIYDHDQGYQGSRDAIIVNGKKVVADVAKEEVTEAVTAPVETVATEAVKKDIMMSKGEVMDTVTMATSSVAPTTTAEPVVEIPNPALPAGVTGNIPPTARPGECYAKVLFPAKYETKTERFQISEEQQVFERMIPAQYEVKTENVKVKDARKYWKSGKGPITRVDQVTGEILCLIEEPAEYRTVTKQVLISPEKPVYTTLPAQFD